VVLSGLNLRLAANLFDEVNFGWGQQQPIDDRFEPIEGPLLYGEPIWMPSPLTKLEFLARAEIDETLVDSLGAVDRLYELSLQHAFGRSFVFGSYVSDEIANYVGDPQVDQRLKAGLTDGYRFTANAHTWTPSPRTTSPRTRVRFGIKLRR
jgi:hypothetical protein